MIQLWFAAAPSAADGGWRHHSSLLGHTGSVVALAFGANNLLASGSYDRTIRLWNVKSGENGAKNAEDGAPLRGHAHWVMGLSFSDDGALLASASYDRYCNTLQHTATHCNTLQHTATHCNYALRGFCII